MISQYEELLNNCDVTVDTDYPIAINKVFNLSTAHVALLMMRPFRHDILIKGTHSNACKFSFQH